MKFSEVTQMRTVQSILVSLLLAGPAFAASGTLKNTPKAVQWSGSVTLGAGPTTEVPECAPGCERFDLTVDLPGGVWINKPGGVEVALRWPGRTLADNLKLYVYHDGVLIASSAGVFSTAQSVLIPEAENGHYKIYAVFDDSLAVSTTIFYDGLAEVEYKPNPQPLRQLLPDLAVRPQQNLSFDPVGIIFDVVSEQYPTCYQSEVDEEGAHLCLRFDQITANPGEGPMELRFSVPSNERPPVTNSFQRIYSSDGVSYQDRFAGQMVFHPVHDHYHFSSFGQTSLWKIGPNGAQLVRAGRKVSFCLTDVFIELWGQKGDGPRTYNAPDCLFPAFSSNGSDFFIQGITNGWADVYDWFLPDQYIEVTGVPDGVYVLQTVADPDNLLLEANESNNCGSVTIQLSNMTAPRPTAVLLGPGPACLK
jgi:hypothetical protein